MQEAGFRSLSMSLRPTDSALQVTGSVQSLDTSNLVSASRNPVIGTQVLQSVTNMPLQAVTFGSTVSPPTLYKPRRRTTRQKEERVYNFGIAMLRSISMISESVLMDESGNERTIPAQRLRHDLVTPQWLLSRGLSWQSFGIYGGWQHNFRTFRYIPRDSLIVDFCLEGDIANVQRMFDKGLASPFDRVAIEGTGDLSLLHVSYTYLLGLRSYLTRFDPSSSLQEVVMRNSASS